MEIVKEVLDTSVELEDHYRDFWKKVYYNDAYVFYKNAILFYKNTQNHKFHNFYNSVINTRLYTGKCIVVDKNIQKTFSNKTNISSDEICNLTLQIINILDSVFNNCPKLPFETIVFRRLSLHVNDLLLNLREGDYYRELGINSTSLNPFYMHVTEWGIKTYQDLQKRVVLTIILPKDTKCYYMNIPFTYKKNNNNEGYFNEFEIVLPRDCIYLIKSKTVYMDIYFYTLELVYQVPVRDRQINTIEEILPSRIPSKEDIKLWNIVKKKDKCKLPKCNWIINLVKDSHKRWIKLPEIEKYIQDNVFVEINPKKFWIYQSIYDNSKNFMKLLNSKKEIFIKDGIIITKKKFLKLSEMLLIGENFKYETLNGNNLCINKFYEISKNIPLLYLIEVNNTKKLKVIRHDNYWYRITKIKLKINNIRYLSITDNYNYGIVKAEIL